MHDNSLQQEAERKNSDIRTLARTALTKLLEPVSGFALDSGLSIGEVQSILREAAVRSAAAKQLETSNRSNISGLAASTGLARAEVSRILRLKNTPTERALDLPLQSTNRILAGWHEDPKYTNANGEPAELKIYGRGMTFESLVKKYGLGIPTRAVFDELVRAGAIEVMDNQKAKAKSIVALDRGVSPQVIKAFGERATELLSTMLTSMRKPDDARFVATVSGTRISESALPLVRKELAVRSADFLADIQESWRKKPVRHASNRKSAPVRISVTVYYHESGPPSNNRAEKNKRRNLKREG